MSSHKQVCGWCKYPRGISWFYDYSPNGVWMYGGRICRSCKDELEAES